MDNIRQALRRSREARRLASTSSELKDDAVTASPSPQERSDHNDNRSEASAEEFREHRKETPQAVDPSPTPEPRSIEPPPKRRVVQNIRMTTSYAFQESQMVVAHKEGPPSEAFRILRTHLLNELEQKTGNKIAVCAGLPNEGKTLVAANLAVSLARHPHRSAVIVDLDLRNPSAHRYFNIEPDLGLSDYLEERIDIDACVFKTDFERLWLLPQPAAVTHAPELLDSPRMMTLLAEIEQRFTNSTVIFDCPPLLLVDDAIISLRYADGCLLVVREGTSKKSDVREAASMIGEEKYIGSVLNDAKWMPASGAVPYGAEF